MVDGLIEACVGLNAQKPLQIVSRGARARKNFQKS